MLFVSNAEPCGISFGKYECRYHGILIYRTLSQGEESIRRFVDDLNSGTEDYNQFLGSFRIILNNTEDGSTVFFGDNSSTECFYYSADDKIFSDSFITVCSKYRSATPNYDAIAQFINFGCIYSYDTVFNEIKRTDSDKYYMFKDNRLTIKDKELSSFDDLKQYDSLHDVIATISNATKGLKTAAVVTGGVDSRMVLSNLMALGSHLELFIAEEPEHIDVRTAGEIAKTLNLPIHVISSDLATENFIEDAFHASDGMVGCCSRYTLPLMRQEMKKEAFALVYGGLAGELYKNSFLNQDFPFYSGTNADIDRLYRIKVAPNDFPDSLCGEKLKEPMRNIPGRLKAQFCKFIKDKKKKSKAYFEIGYWIMKQRAVTFSNAAASAVPAISPLLERDSLALAYALNPYTLELQRFARNEIMQHCPQIAGIKTDRGLSCKSDTYSLCSDFIANYLFLFKVEYGRVFSRNKIPAPGNSVVLLKKAMKSDTFNDALEVCMQFGILPCKITREGLPLTVADRILTLGLLIKNTDTTC